MTPIPELNSGEKSMHEFLKSLKPNGNNPKNDENVSSISDMFGKEVVSISQVK